MRIMENRELKRLKALLSFEEVERNTNAGFEMLSDVDILKAFNLPASSLDVEIYERSLVKRLLTERNNRPSKRTWDEFFNLAKSNDLQAGHAAELYFHLKDRYPIRTEPDSGPDDTPPNIVGGGMEGFGLMADGGGKEEDCD